MKKYLFPALMTLVILCGLLLIVTPYIADWLYPASQSRLHAAKPTEVKQALADWFNTPVANVSEAQALHQVAAQGNTSWFAFSLPRQPVEGFIRSNSLQQTTLTPEVLQQVFMTPAPPVTWWQPASLQRQTYFKGNDAQHDLALVYNAESQRGFLLVTPHEKVKSF